MRCAHIPLNIVPKGVQPSSWNSGKRLTQFCEKDKRGNRGGRRESSLQLKRSALSFKASFREVGLRRSQGQREERPQGRAGNGEVYISFRSSRVWSSILCVQRCSSLVHFSLSSKSSMVFSSLATDLSANSARVSASLSLSVRIFISSSYLSSF